jgi:hypothetical protein
MSTPEDLQNANTDTPTGETELVQGTVGTDKVDTAKAETAPQEEMVSKKEYEKALMRKNQLEKRLEEVVNSKDSTQAEKDATIEVLQAELAAERAERERQVNEEAVKGYESELSNLFEKSLEGQPESVKKVARYNRDKFGIASIVGDAQYSFQAEKNIKDYLNGIAGNVEETPQIKVNATNFVPSQPSNEIEIAPAAGELTKSEHDFLESVVKKDFKGLYSGE